MVIFENKKKLKAKDLLVSLFAVLILVGVASIVFPFLKNGQFADDVIPFTVMITIVCLLTFVADKAILKILFDENTKVLTFEIQKRFRSISLIQFYPENLIFEYESKNYKSRIINKITFNDGEKTFEISSEDIGITKNEIEMIVKKLEMHYP